MATDTEPVDTKQQDVLDAQVIEDTNKIWEYQKQARRRNEFEWFVNDVYYNNNQYFKYNTGTRRIQNISVEKMNDRVVINKVKQQVRGIVNFLNAEHPDVGIRPGDQADDAYLRAKKNKHLADYWYRHLKMNKTAKKISLDGAKYGLGWAKVLWNNDALSPTRPFLNDEGNEESSTYGEIVVDRCDPFEVYPDPMAQTVADQRYMTHAPTRTIAELKANKLYKNTDKVVPDQRLAASLFKQAELRLAVSNANTLAPGQANDMDTVVVLEMFRKIYDKATDKWQVWVTTRTEQGILLRNEPWVLNCYPFSCFQTDIAGMLMDSKGVIHDIKEPNRALNEMMSLIHESAKVMGRLNWLVPRGSNVNVITDETGQFIEYDPTPGGIPHQAAPGNLPTYIIQHVTMLVNFMEDISGMHASFNGKAPFAQASGDLVDTLSAGDQNNLTMLRDNYDDFFVDTFKLMFATAKANIAVSKTFPTMANNEFGEQRWDEIKPADISTKDDVAISTGTAMPYSIAEKQQMYMNLWKEKAITDPKMLFRLLEMPDIDAAMDDDESDVERQLNEIKIILKGKPAPDPEIFEDHQVHIETLDKFAKGSMWDDLKPKQKQYVRDHRQKHIEFSIQLAQIQAALNVEPIKRSETVMIRPTSMNELTAIERTQWFSKFGVNSDAAQIQLRGGLYIQDPAQAEMQAKNENIEMMDMRAVQTSFGDNHIVHLQTHGPVLDQLLMAQKAGQPVSDVVVQLLKDHIKDHVTAMQQLQVAPGLAPNDQMGMPNPPNLQDTGQPGQMPQSDTNAGQGKSAAPTMQSNQAPPNPPPQAPPQQSPTTMQSQQAPIAKPAEKIAPKNKMVNNGNKPKTNLRRKSNG
jgi:hypothetical protein